MHLEGQNSLDELDVSTFQHASENGRYLLSFIEGLNLLNIPMIHSSSNKFFSVLHKKQAFPKIFNS